MEFKREFFSKVKKTVVPRPIVRPEVDILGQRGTAKASDALIYGPNWYHDKEQDLIEIYDAGAAICFHDLLPKKNKYEREGLYLLLSISYRTTENANVNIRTFSNKNVELPNSVNGSIYVDKDTYHFISDDYCLNINSIYLDERLWLQRVDWEWVSRETIYQDEYFKDPWLYRTKNEIEALYAKKFITNDIVRNFLIEKIKDDTNFAKRCLMLLYNDKLFEKDMVSLFKDIGIDEFVLK